MQQVFFRLQGNSNNNDLNQHATVPMCIANQQAHMQSTLSEMVHNVTGHCDVVGTKSENEGLRGFL
jgi:hypothetical protein